MKSNLTLISVVGILLVLSLGMVGSASAASLLVEVKPNPGVAGKAVTITVTAADEGIKYLYSPCDLRVDFGDGTKPVTIGKLEPQAGGILTKSTTHTYGIVVGSTMVKTYTVTVSPLNCDAAKNTVNTVKTTVKIGPPVLKALPR